jgi:NAD(P) transhydrogenase subunit beta
VPYDVVLVIGANDRVKPAAMEDPASRIANVHVLRGWEARQVVFKRSMSTGYAGVQNPLFFRSRCRTGRPLPLLFTAEGRTA